MKLRKEVMQGQVDLRFALLIKLSSSIFSCFAVDKISRSARKLEQSRGGNPEVLTLVDESQIKVRFLELSNLA